MKQSMFFSAAKPADVLSSTCFSNDDEENPTVLLEKAIDLQDLRKPDSQGVCFEVKEEGDCITAKPTDNTCYDPEELCKNRYQGEDSDTSDEDDEMSHFERLETKMVDITPDKDRGVMKQVLKHGSGPIVPANSLVWTHYNAYFEYADEPFDSTRLKKTMKKFRLGQGDVLSGIDVAVGTMKKGELSRYLFKPDYFYGDIGVPPRIPPNATALFEIELVNFVEQAGLDDYFSMTEEEKHQVPFEDIKKLYHTIANEAKHFYQGGRIRQAFTKYRKACTLLEERHLKNEAEETDQRTLLIRVYINIALCCLKQGHSKRAIHYCSRCQELDSKNAKALYINAKALHQLGEYNRAVNYLKRAQRLKPGNREINEEMEKLEKDIAKFRILEKNLYSKMFSQPETDATEGEKREELRAEKAQAKCMECSEQFRTLVTEKMQEFKDDPELMEMPLPSYNLTIGEIECIIETAVDLDLDTNVKGEGSQKQIRVLKKRPEVTT